MATRCQLEIDSDLKNLETIADFVMDATKNAGLSAAESFHVQMSVDEACTNIIQHAYDGESGALRLCCDYDGECFTVTIEDQGRPFDPDTIPQPDLRSSLQERSVGGLGLYFMKTMMDEVHFEFSDECGNRLTMVKRVSDRSADSELDAASDDAGASDGR